MAPYCYLKEVQRGTQGHSKANSNLPSYFFYPLWWSQDLVFSEPGFLIICKNLRSCLIKMKISRSPYLVPGPRAAFKEPLSLLDTNVDGSCSIPEFAWALTPRLTPGSSLCLDPSPFSCWIHIYTPIFLPMWWSGHRFTILSQRCSLFSQDSYLSLSLECEHRY